MAATTGRPPQWLLAATALAGGALLAQPARADGTVNGSHRTELLDCAAGDALVNGDGNRLVFHGACRSLRVNGTANVVQIDLSPGGAVAIAGSANTVHYTPIVPAPSVSAQGDGNRVLASDFADSTSTLVTVPASVAPMSASTLLLDGEQQDRDIACGGQNVVIHGSNGRFTLRGGCISVTVHGRANTIQAQLVPGARVDIGGDAVTLNYTLTSNGPPPVVTVSGANSRAMLYSSSSGPVVVQQPGSTTVIGGQQE